MMDKSSDMEFTVKNFDANGKEFDPAKVVLPLELSREILAIERSD